MELALGLGHSYPEPALLLWTPRPDVSHSTQAPACSQPSAARGPSGGSSPLPGDCGERAPLERAWPHWLASTPDPRHRTRGLPVR